MPECAWEEIKKSVVSGGGKPDLSVYSSIDTAPVRSFLGWNREKTLAKKSKHWLCALEPEKGNTNHFTYSVIQNLLKVPNNSYQPPSLSFYLLLKLQSPDTATAAFSSLRKGAQSQTAQTAAEDSQLEGHNLLGKVLQMLSKSPYVALAHRGNLFQGRFPPPLKWASTCPCPS